MNREDIAALLAKLEAATRSDRKIDHDLYAALICTSPELQRHLAGMDASNSHGYPGYTYSIDEALALVERMLPGALYSVGRGPNHSKRKRKTDGAKIPFDGFVASDDRIGEKSHHFAVTEGPTAPLAILIALLKTLQAKDKP